MQRLGVNTIRVYNLDPSLNHDLCVSIFNAVGIYMFIDVNSPLPNQSLDPGNLKGAYNAAYLNRIFGVVEAFKNYPNVLGFFGGNEDMETVGQGATVPAYLRAVTRDLKNYIAKHSTRAIPVGYSAADVRPILADSWTYLSCLIGGSTTDESRIDFFGLNSYSWCGDQTFQSGGYDVLVQLFSNTSIPVFFSEYGCIKVLPRTFQEVQALYSPQMTAVMSGGLVYEYVQEDNNYGLVWLYDNGTAELRGDYDALQKQYNKLDVKALESGNSSATMVKSPTCSSQLISEQGFEHTFNIPPIPSGGQDLINNGIQNPNNGKIIDVKETSVPQPVYGSSGNELKGLAIKPLPEDESNTPNGDNTSGTASSTGTAPGATHTKKGVAVRVELHFFALVGAFLVVFLCYL